VKRDGDIRNLERALEEERRKSMLDVELQRQVEEAGDNFKNFAAMQRKSELNAG